MNCIPIYPTPRSVTINSGTCQVQPLLCDETTLSRAQRFFQAVNCPVKIAAAENDKHAPDRGYRLDCTAAGTRLCAADTDGLYAGLQAFWQLTTAGYDGTACSICDWPAVELRSFQIDLGRQPETLTELKRLLCQQARYHYNECQLYLENSIKLQVFGEAADPDGLTPDEYRELQAFGADLGIDIVPSLNLIGHMEKILRHPQFAALSETAQGARRPEQSSANCICPELPEAKAFVQNVIAEISELSTSSKLMVGLDECWTLGSHPLTQARLDADGGAGAVLRDWIHFLHAEVKRHDKTMWMWEDMLFYHLGALGDIPADIGMCEWHYQHIEHSPQYSFQNWRRIDALRELHGHGHPVMLCCGPDPSHLMSMLRYAEGVPLAGILVVQWEGRGVVQEIYHLRRAIAAGVLWSGGMPVLQEVARGVTACDPATAATLADWMAYWLSAPAVKRGGTSTCPRYWSWPQNSANLPATTALANTLSQLPAVYEALEPLRLFQELALVGQVADVVRETAALTGRQMLQHGLDSSAIYDDAVAQLAAAVERAAPLTEQAQAMHDRYTAGLPARPIEASFENSMKAHQDLLDRLKRFQTAPNANNWPFARVTLHLDGLVLDACAHSLKLDMRTDPDAPWQVVYDGPARLPGSLEGEFIMSFPLDAAPRQVRLTIGGFAALGIMRIRLETLTGTSLPKRVVESTGECHNPEHLLLFDRKIVTFNEADVMSKWRDLSPPTENRVVLEFA